MTRKPSENKVTRNPALSDAARLLADPKTPKKYRSALASALAQGRGKVGK